ncbi:SUMF1/EgtB/PvdO family nonheme iron enzyme [Bradyrhizobium sp. URHD0069]|uniref:nSTAND1 domain-containing NTPase n=1 Tax=Bradyrhizobium sp. URHD0069 TaxID=1380355 RepID=UPI0009DCC71B|nr:SUMF1/EgtB/PvdO family nonheme iron enzyme [Bradyrhizobium sp. URHD0069]
MRRWFLSYHSPDRALGERLKAALERMDTDSSVFFAPSSLRAGGFWSKALAEEIAQADAFILLVGEKGIGDWQVLEYDEALDKRVKSPDFPVILVLLHGQTAPGLPFLRRLHWVITPDPSSEKDVARLFDAASGSSTRSGDLWRYTSPYRGLAAMEEKDSDYFFGRERETMDVLSAPAVAMDRLPVLLGNSGVGKSSLAQAGILAALKRQAWPEGVDTAPEWPYAFRESRRWCFLTLKPGTEPLKALVESFLNTWQLDATDPERVKQQNGWIELLRDGNAMLRDLLDVTERRYKELDRTKPPAFFLYVDQGEELYVRAEEWQRRRFSEVIAQGVADPRLYMLMSMRADFLGELQKDESLFKVHRKIDVPPLRETELRMVVRRPAELLSARFETDGLADVITRRTAEDSVKDVGALPLLSYTLDDMWTQMAKRGDGVLRLPAQSFELGGILVDRADAFLASHPKSQDELRRILTLKLATVREGEEPTRRRAARSEFTNEEWRLVSELADHPNRLLVTATPEGGETYAEVAHEAVFRRWDKLRNWIAAEREFLAWRTGLEAARRTWQTTLGSSKSEDALLMGAALTQAQSWLAKRRDDLPLIDRDFIDQSSRRERRERSRARRVQALVYVLLVGSIAGLIGWINQSYLRERLTWYTTVRPYMLRQVRPYVLTAAAERALKSGDSFRECAKDCPEMVVVPAGEFMMGSAANERDHYGNEDPLHRVTMARPLAVSKFEVTFEQWDACVAIGACAHVPDSNMGRGTQPVINVSWNNVQQYVVWISTMTGRPYRLLSEAEWEYAARAGTTTAFSWGDEIGKNNADCNGCGSEWDSRRTAPVGSFAPNQFGLYDMHGNVWEWVEDCLHTNYEGAPKDGSAWIAQGDCNHRVVRGGSWAGYPVGLRSALRFWYSADDHGNDLGFRVARTLAP